MDSTDLLRTGRLDEALAEIQAEVRQKPENVELRLRLFAVNCLLGRWDKAMGQMESIGSLNKEWLMPSYMHRALVSCELERAEVFEGKTKPIVMGEPAEWTGWYLEACGMESRGEAAQAWALRAKAWESSPSYPATIDGRSCEWLADVDARLGPILEAYLDGRYYWIPFGQLERWESHPPTVISELIWLPAKLRLVNGADLQAYLPIRYPGTEVETDSALRMSRTTRWQEVPGGVIGKGQKMLQTAQLQFALLESRSVEFGASGPSEPVNHG